MLLTGQCLRCWQSLSRAACCGLGFAYQWRRCCTAALMLWAHSVSAAGRPRCCCGLIIKGPRNSASRTSTIACCKTGMQGVGRSWRQCTEYLAAIGLKRGPASHQQAVANAQLPSDGPPPACPPVSCTQAAWCTGSACAKPPKGR